MLAESQNNFACLLNILSDSSPHLSIMLARGGAQPHTDPLPPSPLALLPLSVVHRNPHGHKWIVVADTIMARMLTTLVVSKCAHYTRNKEISTVGAKWQSHTSFTQGLTHFF